MVVVQGFIQKFGDHMHKGIFIIYENISFN